jgi:hypothetical protein
VTAKAIVEYVQEKSSAVEEFVNGKIKPLATKTYVNNAISASSWGGSLEIRVYIGDEAVPYVNGNLYMSRTVITVVGDMVQVGLYTKATATQTWGDGDLIANIVTPIPMPYADLPIDANNEIGIRLDTRSFRVNTYWERNMGEVRCETFSYMGHASTGTTPE